MIALWSIVAFAREYWQLLLPALPLIGVLGGIGWFARDWRFIAAAVSMVALLIYSGAFFNKGYSAREAELRAEHARVIARRDATIAIITKANEQRAAEDAKRIAELEREIDATPDNAGACFDRDAARRVRTVR